MNSVSILVSRTDRLGDVLLALPTLGHLREILPSTPIQFLIQDLYVPVILPYLKKVNIEPIAYRQESGFTVPSDTSHFLSLYCDKGVAWKAFKSGLRVRVGGYSKLWSFLLYSNGIRQKRSDAIKSEAEYNLDLANLLVEEITGTTHPIHPSKIEIPVDEEARIGAIAVLRELPISASHDFIIFHPGMRGSAANLSPAKYLELINRAEARWELPVILSIGPILRDQEIADFILTAKPSLRVIRDLEISVLREVFRLAHLVIAPSTGPLHLAHYVGTRTIGLYPPVKTQSEKRWAPWGGTGGSRVYSPMVDCPGTRNCIGEKCSQFFCMEKYNWQGLVFA